MRSKEVEEAIEEGKDYIEFMTTAGENAEWTEKVLNYIEELEKYKRKHSLVKNHYVSKDKIRELIEELEGHIWKDGYMTKFDKYAIHYLKKLLGE